MRQQTGFSSGSNNSHLFIIMELFQFSKKAGCYYCGKQEGITREHVPPKVLFQNFECDKITVPACPAHNFIKSEDDEKILLGLAMIVESGLIDFPNHNILNETVISEMGYLKEKFSKAYSIASRTTVWNEPKPDLPSEATLISNSAVEAWIRQITAGLVWAVIGKHEPSINWDAAIVFSPFFYPLPLYSEEDATLASITLLGKKHELDSLTWHTGWSHHQRAYPRDIYRFEVSFDECQQFPETNMIFRHVFYNGASEWFLGVRVPGTTLDAVLRGTKEVRSQHSPSKKQFKKPDNSEGIVKIEKSTEHPGWSRLPQSLIEEIRKQLGNDFETLTKLGEEHGLFNQAYFSKPKIKLILSNTERVTLLGNLICSLGNQLGQRGKLSEAEIAFQISIKLNSEQPFPHFSLAYLYDYQGKNEQAVLPAKEALRLLLRSPEIYNDVDSQKVILWLYNLLNM